MITDKTFRLDIVTPDKIEFSDEVNMVVAPGIEGDLGILPGHIPLVARLKTGVLRIYRGSEKLVMAISDGYMEITRDKVVVLAETAELPEEVDVERALAAQRRAKERLAAHSHDVDLVRAQAALRRAMTRLQVAREGGKRSPVDLSALDTER
jgi:F-type H+-transporting ATPase subunit epsilon